MNAGAAHVTLAPAHPTSGARREAEFLRLQRSHGNRHVARMLVQREDDEAAFQDATAEPESEPYAEPATDAEAYGDEEPASNYGSAEVEGPTEETPDAEPFPEEEPAEQEPADDLSDEESADDESADDESTDGEPLEDQSASEESAPGGWLVDDEVEPTAGQMTRSSFLQQVRSAATGVATEVLADSPFAAEIAPEIDQRLAAYAGHDAASLEQAVRSDVDGAPEAGSASEYVELIGERVRAELERSLRGGGLLDAAGDLVDGVSDAAGAGAGFLGGVGSLLFKADAGGARSADPRAVRTRLGPGEPLERGVAAGMTSAFGHDFSAVRVHADERASGLASELNARAFTVGDDVAFGRDQYRPGSLLGDALIAHELAHVAQQRTGGTAGAVGPFPLDAEAGEDLEEDADRAAIRAVGALWSGAKAGVGALAQTALPRLRSGLRLQRCSLLRPGPPKGADRQTLYEFYLREGTGRLNAVGFGQPLGQTMEDKYDKRFWTFDFYPEGGRFLKLRPRKIPHEAIDALFDNLGEWKLDCTHYVQVAHLYALRHSLGDDEFDQRMQESGEMTIHLKRRETTGVKTIALYSRGAPNAPMKHRESGREEADVDMLVAQAPNGSRIRWTNRDPDPNHRVQGSAFENENTVKIGPDQFAAHPFGVQNRATIERKLGEHALGRAPDAAYIRDNIFISEIEHIAKP